MGECWALNPIWQDRRFDIVSSSVSFLFPEASD